MYLDLRVVSGELVDMELSYKPYVLTPNSGANHRPKSRTLQGWAFSYERGTPAGGSDVPGFAGGIGRAGGHGAAPALAVARPDPRRRAHRSGLTLTLTLSLENSHTHTHTLTLTHTHTHTHTLTLSLSLIHTLAPGELVDTELRPLLQWLAQTLAAALTDMV